MVDFLNQFSTYATDVVRTAGERAATGNVDSFSELSRIGSQFLDSTTAIEARSPEHRVRISPKPGIFRGNRTGEGALTQILGENIPSNIMQPLYETNGLIFPFTPTITSSIQADYTNYQPTHSNQDFYTYQKTPTPQFQIAGIFTAQTKEEAAYALACIHFFRTITKMYFGADDDLAGVTPPILHLNGYGKYMFNNLPVLINNYSVELMHDIDYVKVIIDGSKTVETDVSTQIDSFAFRTSNVVDKGEAWIPSRFMMTCNCIVQHTPKRMRSFDLNKFRTGQLMREDYEKGGWW